MNGENIEEIWNNLYTPVKTCNDNEKKPIDGSCS